MTQVKHPKTLNFKTLAEASKEPGDFLLSDFSKLDRPPLLHVAFMAIGQFEETESRLPGPCSVEDADKVQMSKRSASLPPSLLFSSSRHASFLYFSIYLYTKCLDFRLQVVQKAKEINSNLKICDGDLDEKVIRLLAHGASCQVNAMCAILGGIVGQEVLKASSGKFHPINQFFYCDFVESLPNELECNPWVGGDEFMGSGCRYDDQVLYSCLWRWGLVVAVVAN